MKSLTLKQLRYFHALARLRHFGLAADACAISQPALSMQIKELETGLPAPLFERSPKGLRLTRFGTEFAARAHAILREVDALGDFVRARAEASGLGGRLAMGVIPTVAPYYLPRMMGALHHSFAGLDVTLREAMTQTLLADLDEGRLDCAIIALPHAAPNLTQTPLFSEDFVLVRPAADAARPIPSPRDLRHMRLLLLEEGHCFRDQALAFCAAAPAARPREVMDGSSLTTLVQMVGAGMGVTLIPDMAVTVETRAAAVCIQRFAAPAPKRQIGMVWRKSAPFASALTQVAAVLRSAAA
ncbi:MAG: hydrogen peroxide-inducible genes activator [Cypionkella sp.]|nr:hydrogen peroxide-inducible genes activator [Cypionkella sp.]